MPQIQNAYVRFFNSVRDSVKDENPELENAEVLSEIAKRWKSMDPVEKQPFFDAEQKDKEKNIKTESVKDKMDISKYTTIRQYINSWNSIPIQERKSYLENEMNILYKEYQQFVIEADKLNEERVIKNRTKKDKKKLKKKLKKIQENQIKESC